MLSEGGLFEMATKSGIFGFLSLLSLEHRLGWWEIEDKIQEPLIKDILHPKTYGLTCVDQHAHVVSDV